MKPEVDLENRSTAQIWNITEIQTTTKEITQDANDVKVAVVVKFGVTLDIRDYMNLLKLKGIGGVLHAIFYGAQGKLPEKQKESPANVNTETGELFEEEEKANDTELSIKFQGHEPIKTSLGEIQSLNKRLGEDLRKAGAPV